MFLICSLKFGAKLQLFFDMCKGFGNIIDFYTKLFNHVNFYTCTNFEKSKKEQAKTLISDIIDNQKT